MNETVARQVVRQRSSGRCELCATTRAASWSHRRSRGQGGLWAPSNGCDLCGDGVRGCHGWVEANPRLAAAGGWRIRDRRTPDRVPVWLDAALAGPGWWLLDDAGVFYPIHPADEDLPDRPVLPPWARLAA